MEFWKKYWKIKIFSNGQNFGLQISFGPFTVDYSPPADYSPFIKGLVLRNIPLTKKGNDPQEGNNPQKGNNPQEMGQMKFGVQNFDH